jgi:hypothetical protein
MVVVLTILAALFVGGAYALYLQIQDTRAAGYVSRERQALYCAEAGLVATRQFVAANQPLWGDMLNPNVADPAGYPVQGDLTGDGQIDFIGTIEDNLDEPPDAHDPFTDNDLRLYVISRCVQFPDSPREVRELVEFAPIGGYYRSQAGHGPGGTGNTNTSTP